MLFVPDNKNVSAHSRTLIILLCNRRRSDCSGLALLKAITSANDEEIHRLARFWVYSDEPQADGDEFPFLFINGGAATLSGSTLGAAIVRDTVTRRKIQILEHTGIYRLCPPAALSYAYVGCSWPPRLYDGTSRSTQGWGNTQYFLFRKGISRFEQQVQHRDSGSWDKRYNQGLDRTAAFLPSPKSGEWWFLSVAV